VKDVHKSPALDLVGWYTIVPTSGPQQHHVALQAQLSSLYSEATILLGFHPEAVLEGSVGGKLPLTIYEANFESSESARREDVDMKDVEYPFPGLFKELPYSVETGEAEMIGVDFVARGGGNATAVETAAKTPASKKDATTLKGKSRQESEEEDYKPVDMNVLSREEEELIASLTAKANAIKMLHSRINLITTYLEKLPPHVTGKVTEPPPETGKDFATVDHSILRSIQALLNRLTLLVPADNAAFSQELLAEQNDVNLVSLLSTVTESIMYAREMGRKFAVVDQARNDKSRSRGANSDAWKTSDAFNPEKLMGRNIGGVGDLMM
jgi:COP9 signalosome complex subunit 6